MPIPPKPRTYVCQSCGWKKTVVPISDVLLPGDIVRKCEKCGCAELLHRSVTVHDFMHRLVCLILMGRK